MMSQADTKQRSKGRHRVYCTQWAQCGWTGYRASDRIGIQSKPCPKCGLDVTR